MSRTLARIAADELDRIWIAIKPNQTPDNLQLWFDEFYETLASADSVYVDREWLSYILTWNDSYLIVNSISDVWCQAGQPNITGLEKLR